MKYREVNDLHKQMLRVERPRRGDAGRPGPRRRPGPPLRRPVERLLLARPVRRDLPAGPAGVGAPPPRSAPRTSRSAAPGAAVASGQLDRPRPRRRRRGRSSSDDGQIVAVKLDEGGGIGRWDLRAAGHPLAAVMRRRPEAYHETLREHDGAAPTTPAAGGAERRRRPARLDPRHRDDEAGRPGRAAPLRRLRAAIRASSGCCRSGTAPAAVADGSADGSRRHRSTVAVGARRRSARTA